MKPTTTIQSLPPRPAGFLRTSGRVLACSLVLAATFSTRLHAQETYYYKKGEKVTLEVDKSKTFVLFAPETTKAAVQEATKPVKATLKRFEAFKSPENLNFVLAPQPARPKWAIIDNGGLALAPGDVVSQKVEYKAPFFKTKDKKQIGMSHLLYVKLKDAADKAKLEAVAKEFKVTVVGNNKQMPLWYTLSCKKDSAGNALEVANKIFETNEFAAAEPDFLADFQIQQAPACPDDDLFTKQWALKNTGQSNGGTAGPDLGVCDAWSIATGKGVTVAIVDQGVELKHPDLKLNASSKSFDTETTGPSRVVGNHGTACAGIVGALRGNSKLGVVGVAPDSTLMSVSDSLALEPGAQQRLASGISWAWQNGADVISNSWGHNQLESPLIDDAIEEALQKGRGGKGCVVVFAAGNDDGPVIYPARTNPQVLAVGAMAPCGQRKSPSSCDPEHWWGGCFGSALDVMAPGVLIPTTDRTGASGYDSGDYTLDFNGTSSATPHVAGVAALILSVNPSLKQEQVVKIIEETARKVGPYSYQPAANRPNGTWYHEAGYGMVDAKACVEAAQKTLKPPGH